MSHGRLIVVDSPEGAGKTTLLTIAKKRIEDGPLADKVIFTREPGGSEYAEAIRALILGPMGKQADARTLMALFWAARADHIKNTVRPALEAGIHVVSDRFDSATYAYQIWGYENYDLVSTFNHMREVYMKGIVPFYVFLNVDPDVGLARKSRHADVNFLDQMPKEFHQRVYRGFGEFLAGYPFTSAEIDASQPPHKVAEDFLKIFEIVIAGGTPPKVRSRSPREIGK